MHSTAPVLYPPSCVHLKEHLSHKHLSSPDTLAGPEGLERSRSESGCDLPKRKNALAGDVCRQEETADRFPGQPFELKQPSLLICCCGCLLVTAVLRRRSSPGDRLDRRLVHRRETRGVEGCSIWDEGRRRGLGAGRPGVNRDAGGIDALLRDQVG